MQTYYSHIERDDAGSIVHKKRLLEHISEVAESCRAFIQAFPLTSERKDKLVELAFLIGVAHDFGKYTSYFQSYLLENAKHGLAKNHSFISAVWGAFLISSKQYEDVAEKLHDMLLCFGAILYHHGNLDNISSVLKDILDYASKNRQGSLELGAKQTLDALFKEQLPDLLKHAQSVERELRTLLSEIPDLSAFELALNDSKSDFYADLREALFCFEDWVEEKKCERYNYELYLLFSVLIDADKRDAARIDVQLERREIPENVVQQFIAQTTFATADAVVEKIRKELFGALNSKASEVPLEQKVFTITSPTGSGKTLAALNFAIKLRNRIENKQGYSPRIIYALPFTSIIDQNHNVFEDVLSLLPDFQANYSQYLLKHHHLADVQYKIEKVPEDALPLDKSLLLIESWEAEIVVTTYVQLFHTIIGAKNRFLKKYHNIAGSIIILDEIQNVPVEYWPLIQNILKWFTEVGNCTVMLMTATQPLIFPPEEAVELVSDPTSSFQRLDRIHFHIDHEQKELGTFADEFLEQLEEDKSYAVILNTIKSSIEFYELVAEYGTDAHELFYLSTNIIPRDRLERINRMREKLKNREPVILISTQVIEAGVDLDFDVIYRDVAPIDSLVQAAGRANRHGVHGKGNVYIIRLIDDENREFAQWIYGKAHLWVANALLKDRQHLGENEFFALVRQNYEQLLRRVDTSKGKEIFREWWQAANYEVLQNFKLIGDKYYYVDVFVAINNKAETIWQRYLSGVLAEKNFRRKNENYLAMRSDFKKFIVSVPEKLTKEFFWDGPLRGDRRKPGYIPSYAVADYYESETGYKRTTEDDEVMIF